RRERAQSWLVFQCAEQPTGHLPRPRPRYTCSGPDSISRAAQRPLGQADRDRPILWRLLAAPHTRDPSGVVYPPPRPRQLAHRDVPREGGVTLFDTVAPSHLAPACDTIPSPRRAPARAVRAILPRRTALRDGCGTLILRRQRRGQRRDRLRRHRAILG